MPLTAVSPNIPEPVSPSRKRTLESVAVMEIGVKSNGCSENNENKENGSLPSQRAIKSPLEEPGSAFPSTSKLSGPQKTASPKKATATQPISAFFSPASKQTTPQPSRTDSTMPSAVQTPVSSGVTPTTKRKLPNDENSPIPLALTQSAPGSARQPDQPPPKKKRATKEEVEAKKKEVEAKKEEEARIKEEKERLKAERAAEKAAKEAQVAADKQAKAEERERKRKLKEEEENKKREEQARKQAEKDKKARSQPKLFSYLKPTAGSKEKKPEAAKDTTAAASTSTEEPSSKKELSQYEQTFQPFFVHSNVTLAPLFYLDEPARETKGRVFEEYVHHKREAEKVKPFNPMKALELPSITPRGQLFPAVRDVMLELTENSARKPIDLTSGSQNSQIRDIRKVLQEIPMKLLCFKEDVRPPYYGTVTNVPGGLLSLRKLARNPVAKDVLPLNYDYDSEAEWQEDDGEDVDLADDEEDELDDEEGMDDFLDDSEDVGLTRLPLASGLEPESTGICWENRKRLGPAAHMYKFRMEFILDTLDHHSGVDPFSTAYWETPKEKSSSAALATNTSKVNSIMKSSMPSPAPADALKMLAASAAVAPHKGRAATVVIQGDMLQKLKDMVVAKKGLSKVGIVELFGSENKVPKSAIKNTLEIIAMKSGKDWVLRPDA